MKIAKLLLFLVILGGLTFNLSSVPPLWWDEGWTISLARNWVELGIYGQINNGVAQSPGLSAAFPVVVPIALSFKLFGVGVWQGRLPFVLFTLGSFLLLYYLGKNLYSPKIALGAIFLSIFTPMALDLNPLILGRQILGEMPAIFFLLAGLVALYNSQQKNIFLILLTILLWGLAIRTKAQILPLLGVAICLTMGILILKRELQKAIVLAIIMIGSYLCVKYLLASLQSFVVGNHMVPYQKIEGIANLFGFVLIGKIRINAILWGFTIGIPTLGGLVYFLIKWSKKYIFNPIEDDREVIRLTLFSLVGVWYAWFILFAMDFPRYLFPSLVLGSIFISDLVYDITCGFDIKTTWRKVLGVLMPWRFRKFTIAELCNALVSFIVITWIGFSVFVTIGLMFFPIFVWENGSPAKVAEFINNYASSTAVVETYDSELFFFLRTNYHYPPDQLSVDLTRRKTIDPTWQINYDPLEADPDFLVVGPFSKTWELYDPVIKKGFFSLLKKFPLYDVYIRNQP